MNPIRWLEKMFGLFGEMQSLVITKNFALLELKKFEMKSLLEVEFV